MPELIGKILFFIILFIIATSISCFIIMTAWSLFMVPIFKLPEITFFQALGLNLLLMPFRISGSSKK